MSMKQNDETQERWYMVNKDGMVTLCTGHCSDAAKEAKLELEKMVRAALAAAPAQERIQALELEVRQLTEQIAELRGGAAYSLPEWLEVMHASEIRGIWNDCKRDGLHYVAFAWRIERLGWQRLLDALRSSRGKAPAQQPAPSAAPAGTYMTPEQVRDGIADWIDENILHREFWTPEVVDLVRSIEINPAAISPKPVPTPQADSQPAPVLDALPREDFAWLVVQEACETEPADEDAPECIRILRLDLKSAVLAAFLRHDAARAPADSVLEDAARYRWIRGPVEESTRYSRWRIEYWDGPNGWQPMQRERMDSAIDAARKQGGQHEI